MPIPPSSMGSHFTEAKVSGLDAGKELRYATAAFGAYGYEFDPRKLSKGARARLREYSQQYKREENVVLRGGSLSDLFLRRRCGIHTGQRRQDASRVHPRSVLLFDGAAVQARAHEGAERRRRVPLFAGQQKLQRQYPHERRYPHRRAGTQGRESRPDHLRRAAIGRGRSLRPLCGMYRKGRRTRFAEKQSASHQGDRIQKGAYPCRIRALLPLSRQPLAEREDKGFITMDKKELL